MSANREAEPAYDIATAAGIKGVSSDTIRRAIKATEPPFLRAKKVGSRYSIPASELDAWHAQLEDA